MIVYPDSDYDSFVSEDEAEEYFLTRLHSDQWNSKDAESALLTAYRTLQSLDIVLDLSETEALKAIKEAQMEQAYHELINQNTGALNSLSLGGLLSVKMDSDKQPPRYSERALALLRPYLRAQTLSRTR